jgi:hypothetical protein
VRGINSQDWKVAIHHLYPDKFSDERHHGNGEEHEGSLDIPDRTSQHRYEELYIRFIANVDEDGIREH